MCATVAEISASMREVSANHLDMCAILAPTFAILGVEDAFTTALRANPSRERPGRA
jgi:hypothetical protein